MNLASLCRHRELTGNDLRLNDKFIDYDVRRVFARQALIAKTQIFKPNKVADPIFGLSFSANGRVLGVTTLTGRVAILSDVTQDYRQKLKTEIFFDIGGEPINNIQFDPRNEFYFVTGGDECVFRLHDLRFPTTSPVASHRAHTEEIKNIHFYDEHVVSYSVNSQLVIWDHNKSQIVRDITNTSADFFTRTVLSEPHRLLVFGHVLPNKIAIMHQLDLRLERLDFDTTFKHNRLYRPNRLELACMTPKQERIDGLQIYYIDSEDRQLNVDGLAETPGVDDLDDNVEHLHLHLYKIYSIDVNPTAKSIAYRIFRDFDQTEMTVIRSFSDEESSRIVGHVNEQWELSSYIKNISWSPDGRYLLSPHLKTLRLIAMNENRDSCGDAMLRTKMLNLNQASLLMSPKPLEAGLMLTATFHPNYVNTIASGDDKGNIVLYRY